MSSGPFILLAKHSCTAGHIFLGDPSTPRNLSDPAESGVFRIDGKVDVYSYWGHYGYFASRVFWSGRSGFGLRSIFSLLGGGPPVACWPQPATQQQASEWVH